MAFQVVGLEIGLTEIKLVKIIKKINSIEIAQLLRYKITSSDDFTSIIKEIFSKYKIRGDLFVVGISSRKAIFRNLSLPFKNINRINKVMKYEVEPYLPYPMEEAILTSQLNYDDNKEGVTNLFIGAVQKETVDFYCQGLNASGIDPQYIMLDCIALYNLYLRSISPDSREIVTLIDINEERTLLVIAQGEYLLFSRSILNPLRICFNYDALAEAKDLHFTESKIQTGAADSSGNDWDHLLGSLKAPIDSLLEKIDFTLYAFSSHQVNASISKIFLTGEIAIYKKITEYFTEKLEIKTSFFDPIKAIGKVAGENVSFKNQAAFWSVPLGLAMEVKKNKKNRFNLRQEELAYRKKYTQFKVPALVLLLLFSVATSLLILNIYYQTSIHQKKLDRINTKIQQVYNKVFPKADKPHNELLQTKKELKLEKEKYRAYKVFSQRSLTHLQILKDLSVQISKEIQVEFINLSIDRNQIKIKGIANSFESVDRLKNSLQKINKYAQTVVESAQVKGAESKVDFRLNITTSDAASDV